MRENYNRLFEKYLKKESLTDEVKRFNIMDNRIHARISDTHIIIEFEKFSHDDKNKIEKMIKGNLKNTNQILNNIIPKDIIDSGIKVYPTSLYDLKITSSKNELGDIFSVLEVLNDKCLEFFKMKGIDLKLKNTTPLKTSDDLFNEHYNHGTPKKSLQDLYELNKTLYGSDDESLDFIYLELFESLKKETERFKVKSGEFKEYVKFRHFKNKRKTENEKEVAEFFNKKWNPPDDIKLPMTSNYKLTRKNYINNEQLLFTFLIELNQLDKNYLTSRENFLVDVLNLTFKLIKYNALVPEIYTTQDNQAHMRWTACVYDDGVLNLYESLYEKCPDDLITFNQKKLSKETQITILISLIMKGFIEYFFEKNPKKTFEKQISTVEFKLICQNPVEVTSDEKQKTVQKIAEKYQVFFLKSLDFNYILSISDDLKVEIKVRTDNRIKSIKQANKKELSYMKSIYNIFTYFKIDNILYEKIQMSDDEFLIFNEKIKPMLGNLNTDLETEFEIIDNDFKITLDTNIDEKDFSLNKLIECNWSVDINGVKTNLTEISEDKKLIKTEHKYYVFNTPNFRNFKEHVESVENEPKNHSILQLALLEEFNNIKFKLSDNFKNLISKSSIYEVPKSLESYLRPYQKIGYSWLVQNIESGFGSILADDMGLGKTLQVLSAILYLKKNNHLNEPALIIVPPTLISNWENEIEKFTPELTYSIYHGSKRILKQKNYDIILTSYGVVKNDLDKFIKRTWFLCIIDEAQNIKNPKSQQTRAVKQIKALNKIALTGTPIENKLLDYWSIFDFVNPGYLSGVSEFKRKYVRPIEKFDDESVLENLKTIAKPFVLRRLKSDKDIISELPEKVVNDIYCRLTQKQMNLYDMVMTDSLKSIEKSDGIKRKGMIFKTITSLKQICNHPSHFLKKDSSKLNESGKMELLVNVLENILDIDEKVIIFTQYLKMGEIIHKLLSKKFNSDILFLHGKLSRNKRSYVIDEFQNNPQKKILIATLKTGGVGLNLTAASNVIHYDLWWNPAVENQATDRVHRIGQNSNVIVYRFITRGTLEENIDLIVKNKIDLAEKTISNDETFISEMTNEELREMLSLRL